MVGAKIRGGNLACGVELWDCVIQSHKNSALVVTDMTYSEILQTISEINLNESL